MVRKALEYFAYDTIKFDNIQADKMTEMEDTLPLSSNDVTIDDELWELNEDTKELLNSINFAKTKRYGHGGYYNNLLKSSNKIARENVDV